MWKRIKVIRFCQESPISQGFSRNTSPISAIRALSHIRGLFQSKEPSNCTRVTFSGQISTGRQKDQKTDQKTGWVRDIHTHTYIQQTFLMAPASPFFRVKILNSIAPDIAVCCSVLQCVQCCVLKCVGGYVEFKATDIAYSECTTW